MTDQQKAFAEFEAKHPFRMNLLRVTDDKTLMHVNSYFENYNDSEQKYKENDDLFCKRIICNTPKEITKALKETKLEGRQKFYILTSIRNFRKIKQIDPSELED